MSVGTQRVICSLVSIAQAIASARNAFTIRFKSGNSAEAADSPPRKFGGQGVPRTARGAKRLACALLAALILAQVSVPPKATVAALGSVGAVAVVGAFLMASGIYPYITGDDTLSEWTDSALQSLIDAYNNQAETEKRMFITGANAIKGFLVNGVAGTIAIAKKQWGLLRDFANWIISEFSITDNQTGVQLGNNSLSGIAGVYRMPQLPTGISSVTKEDVVLYGAASVQHSNGYAWYLCADSDYNIYTFCNVSGSTIVESNISTYAGALYYAVSYNASTGVYDNSSFRSVRITSPYSFVDGIYTYSGYRTLTNYSSPSWSVGYPQSVGGSFNDIVKPYSKRVITDTGQEVASSDVIVDTIAVSVPDALPDDEEWGGLQVPEATVGVNPEIVIETAIEGHLQPEVNPVSVKISPDIIVNQDTGQVTQNPIIITGDDVPYSPDAFQAQSLQDKFPFSIPWDIYRIYSALNATSQRPEFHFSLTFPIVGTYELDVAIPDDIAPQVDAFAATFRNMILVLLCVWSLFKARDWIRFS